jgi:hypothetical protein
MGEPLAYEVLECNKVECASKIQSFLERCKKLEPSPIIDDTFQAQFNEFVQSMVLTEAELHLSLWRNPYELEANVYVIDETTSSEELISDCIVDPDPDPV